MNSSYEDWTSEQAFRLFAEWHESKAILWLSCAAPLIQSVASECWISSLSESEVTFSFGAKNGVVGSITLPFSQMNCKYFHNASDAPFQPPGGNDHEMGQCMEFKFPFWPSEIMVCKKKHQF